MTGRSMVLVAVALGLAFPAKTMAEPTGALTQKSGVAGCISNDGSGGACADGRALLGTSSVTVAPDGRSVYVTTFGDDEGVAILDRDPATGEIAQKAGTAGCVHTDGPFTDPTCLSGRGLTDPSSVAVSPDGTSVYVAGSNSDAIAVFDRDPFTGRLFQKDGTAGCVSDTGAPSCQDGTALNGVVRLSVSPDGLNVYGVSSLENAVAVFSRDPQTGALTQLPDIAGCVSLSGHTGSCAPGTLLEGVSEVAVSPDGEHAYAASFTSDALVSFDRDAMTGALTQRTGTDSCVVRTGVVADCVNSAALNGPFALAIAGDGATVAVAAFDGDALVAVDRDASGALSLPAAPNGCVSDTGSGGACHNGAALNGATSVAITGDGTSVYVAGLFSNGVAALRRDPATGRVTQPAGAAGCVTLAGTDGCRPGVAMDDPRASPPRPTDAACTSPRSFPSLSTCSTASRPPPVPARRSRSCTTSPGRSRSTAAKPTMRSRSRSSTRPGMARSASSIRVRGPCATRRRAATPGRTRSACR